MSMTCVTKEPYQCGESLLSVCILRRRLLSSNIALDTCFQSIRRREGEGGGLGTRADWELLVVLKAVWRESSINPVPAYFLP